MRKRAGKTRTKSISVDAETSKILEAEAKRHYRGNVSQLICALAKEAQRKAAFDWILAWYGGPRMTDDERDALLAEIDGKPAPKKKRTKSAA